MYIYSIVATSFLDDYNDDYIKNSIVITNRIIESNTDRVNNTIHLERILYDAIGIYEQTFITSITITFTKVFYPRVDALLKQYG